MQEKDRSKNLIMCIPITDEILGDIVKIGLPLLGAAFASWLAYKSSVNSNNKDIQINNLNIKHNMDLQKLRLEHEKDIENIKIKHDLDSQIDIHRRELIISTINDLNIYNNLFYKFVISLGTFQNKDPIYLELRKKKVLNYDQEL